MRRHPFFHLTSRNFKEQRLGARKRRRLATFRSVSAAIWRKFSRAAGYLEPFSFAEVQVASEEWEEELWEALGRLPPLAKAE